MSGGGEVHVNFDTKSRKQGMLRTTLYSNYKPPTFKMKISDFCKIGKLHMLLGFSSYNFFTTSVYLNAGEKASNKERCNRIINWIKAQVYNPSSITDDDLSDDKDLFIYLDNDDPVISQILSLGVTNGGYAGRFTHVGENQYMWKNN